MIVHHYMYVTGIGSRTITHGVREISRAVVVISWIKGHRAIIINRNLTNLFILIVLDDNFITRFNRCTIDFCDCQWIAIDIGVIVQNWNDDRFIFWRCN